MDVVFNLTVCCCDCETLDKMLMCKLLSTMKAITITTKNLELFLSVFLPLGCARLKMVGVVEGARLCTQPKVKCLIISS